MADGFALRSAGEVGYRSVPGTVEFLLVTDDQSFYFLEMNTRLQVEHPVTEMVYGVDLVAAQIAVARGEALSDALKSASPRGHAIEVRLYAEDASTGFLPTPGRILRLVEPRGPGLRFDSGFELSGEVSPEYDPMIAKLIAWGEDRAAATARLLRGLRECALLGLTTNQSFLIDILDSSWFAAGDFHTKTVEDRMAESDSELGAEAVAGPEVFAAAAWALVRGESGSVAGEGAAARGGDAFSPFGRLGSWRLFSERGDH